MAEIELDPEGRTRISWVPMQPEQPQPFHAPLDLRRWALDAFGAEHALSPVQAAIGGAVLDSVWSQGIAEGRRQTVEEVDRIVNAQHDVYQSGLAEGRRQATEGAYGAEPADLGAGYRELELAHGRWYWLEDLGIRVMVGLKRPFTLLRWKALDGRQATEGWEREWSAELYGSVDQWAEGDEGYVRMWADDHPGAVLRSRVVGPWEPAPETSQTAEEAS
jgi:hypothetical protein